MSRRLGRPNYENRLPDDDFRLPAIRRAQAWAALHGWRDHSEAEQRAREFLYMLDAALELSRNSRTVAVECERSILAAATSFFEELPK
jgi:hypothetical protein